MAAISEDIFKHIVLIVNGRISIRILLTKFADAVLTWRWDLMLRLLNLFKET